MVLTPAEMKAVEEAAFGAGVSAEALMEEAGRGVAEAVRQFHPAPGVCVVAFGKGHNGADALVAARHLAEWGWSLRLLPAAKIEEWSELTKKKYRETGRHTCWQPGSTSWLAEMQSLRGERLIILDGLLGVGSGGALRGAIRTIAEGIATVQKECGARVVAIDLPTGLDGESGKPGECCIKADLTVTLGYAKRGLLADTAPNHVGRLALVPFSMLDSFLPGRTCADSLAEPTVLSPLLPRREYDSHKGTFGRVSIVAGSRGFTGAALMCSAGCIRAGAGLVSLFVLEDVYPIAAAAALPEVMVHPVKNYREVLEMKVDVLAVGPGLGKSRATEILPLLEDFAGPMVVDADGLNILSDHPDSLARAAGPRLLTPHPGEMARLYPAGRAQGRREAALTFVETYQRVTLLLKGARTIVAQSGQPVSFNTTGNPGMSTGGMGDVLTGVCAALAGQGLNLYDAARLGAWVCGRAAELSISHGFDSPESLTPSSLLTNLGRAFRELSTRCW